MLQSGEAGEQQPADVGQRGSAAGGDAIAGYQNQEPAQGVIDRRRGLEVFDGAEKFGGDGGHDGLGGKLLPAMWRAERGVALAAQHAAAAAIGGNVAAAVIGL